MPVITIKSLPFDGEVDIPYVLSHITESLSLSTQVDAEHIHVSWEFFLPGHYAKGGKTPLIQPLSNHPVMIEILIPDFHRKNVIDTMMESLADSIALHTDVARNNILITQKLVSSGRVFDNDEVVQW
ncbi:hypothetical protein [Teredinibacter sp. KSP-S5-2]|uniref:hypothetical protein n=1 Tax=Teredinibacter sp. KSP-S5-2 TaxID=3034506 RepID=UPI002934B2FF|nr:hypothetical protein [Teredinibacter sp. KSP-S5-2]WNO09656.1 hypothetical protein P5V12_00490 [Teredinibacter sp. KSP-S5-2]